MDLQKIKKTVEEATYFSGVIQMVENGTIILNRAHGYSKREDSLPNNTDTAFGIASGTKGFTALGILKLIEKRKLSLDDRVFELLPYDFPNMNKKITVKQLLTHTSGIYDYFDEEVVEDFGQLFEKVPVHKILGPKDMLLLMVDGKSYFEPGEKFKYCNSGFVILGMLIEITSGMPYADYIHNEVITPLGLKKTGCFKTNQLPPNCAYGYIRDEDKTGKWYSNIFEIPPVCTADGGIYTTADDMNKIWKELFSGNFLNKNLLQETFTPQVHAWDETYYGLGFWIQKNKEQENLNEDNKDQGISHYYLVGADPGVCFHSQYFIKEDRILTILGNTSDDADTLLEEMTPYL